MLRDQPFDIFSLHEAYRNGLSPRAVVEECRRRIDKANDPGIFLHLIDPDSMAAEADALGPFDPLERPLWGVPFALKDNIDAAATPTTAACPAYAYTADKDAFVVQTLRRAGALLIGKTNLDQFATGLVGLRSPYPPPKNALQPEMVPGGSSSGSAVAVAHGIVSFALGTDTAGSGRVPAALNGIVGLKPTLGAISSSGVIPACRTLDTVSVFALNTEDAYKVFSVAAVFDLDDPYARQIASPQPGRVPAKFSVGVPDEATRQFFGDALQAASFSASLKLIRELGGEIVELDFTPFYQVAEMLYEGAWVAERYTVIEPLLSRNDAALHPVTRNVIEQAKELTAVDAFRGFYQLQELKRRVERLTAGIDLLCVPSIPRFYTLAELEADPFEPNARLGTYTNFANLLNLCGITLPVAPRTDGLPGSITLLANAGRDAQIAALGGLIQQRSAAPLGATRWSLPQRPPGQSIAPAADEIALAVVGAHMSGLALNHELTRLDARFLYPAKTVAGYRLYSLPGGPPFRPGLIADASGSAIELEVWALPAARFADFIKGIPRPLCIGTLQLDNGAEVKGFLCEPSGTVGAQEVTNFGGWRAYLNANELSGQTTKESKNAKT